MRAIDHLAVILERIIQQAHREQIILFGSWARGDARPDSDIDLLIVMPEGTPKRSTAVAIRRLLADIPVSLDLVITSASEIARYRDYIGPVIRPALREGRVLYDAARAS